jgi:arylsulfatase A-like enzyme
MLPALWRACNTRPSWWSGKKLDNAMHGSDNPRSDVAAQAGSLGPPLAAIVALLSVCEIAITVFKGGAFFLSWAEVLGYAAVSFVAIGASVFGAWLLLHRGVAPVLRSAPWLRTKASAMVLAVIGVAALVIDGTLYVRLYPGWHALLSVAAVACAAMAVETWRQTSAGNTRAEPRKLWSWAFASVVAACPALFALSIQPNASLVTKDFAPVTGKLLALLPQRAAQPRPIPAKPPLKLQSATAGLELAGKHVLLITVDALRADMLSAYGGRGLTPRMDALAERGFVFRRAYTPSPNTSYALASMLTGKHLRALARLGGDVEASVTLADLLSQAGYQTAAFYPPAVFSVDGQKFQKLQKRGFGFGYQKIQFSDAEARIDELEAFLKQKDDRPVFAWVHFFEPHEPYEPLEKFHQGEALFERYQAEVARVDAAVGEMVERFSKRCPQPVVIVSADHGEEFGEHGGRFHGTTLYDEQVRVPLVWFAPGKIVKASRDTPVEILDIATTLLALLGVPADPRMGGDDWSALLGGAPDTASVAFAEVGDLQMVFDGQYKAICSAGHLPCRLFDLQHDPKERRNLALALPPKAAVLAGQLASFFDQLPARERLAWEDQASWPRALARARLGDVSAAPELMPLLQDDAAGVRASAVRELGKLQYLPSTQVLKRMADEDASVRVRAEAALALLRLKQRDAVAMLRLYFGRADIRDQPWSQAFLRAAAIELALRKDATGVGDLIDAASDPNEELDQREHAVKLLGTLRAKAAVPALISLLSDTYLRMAAAESLGRIGDARAREPLRTALAKERYPEARQVQGRALRRL